MTNQPNRAHSTKRPPSTKSRQGVYVEQGDWNRFVNLAVLTGRTNGDMLAELLRSYAESHTDLEPALQAIEEASGRRMS